MIKILRTIVKTALLLIAISLVSFLITFLAPSDAAQIMLEAQGNLVTEETLSVKRAELGLDRPVLVQYGDWLGGALRGDLGRSFKSGKPVRQELLNALPNTALLTIVSTVLSVILAIPAAMMSAKRKNGLLDGALGAVSYILISFPSFFVSLVALYIFALKLGWFNVIGGDRIRDAVLPIGVLSITTAAWMTRQVRSLLLKEYSKDYVFACRSRGAGEGYIMRKHILKNCMLPISTLVGISFASILGGTLIVENVFNWSGMGQLVMKAITNRDYPVIQGYVIFMSLSLLVLNALIDMLYLIVDPRVRAGTEVAGER